MILRMNKETDKIQQNNVKEDNLDRCGGERQETVPSLFHCTPACASTLCNYLSSLSHTHNGPGLLCSTLPAVLFAPINLLLIMMM